MLCYSGASKKRGTETLPHHHRKVHVFEFPGSEQKSRNLFKHGNTGIFSKFKDRTYEFSMIAQLIIEMRVL